MSSGNEPIDESLYSRQLYVMGHEAQRRMAGSNVLIVGLNGLGVETAKNVILAGVKTVTLHDNTPASWTDMSAQFYITTEDLGQPRALVSAPKLAALNPYVAVSVMQGELNLQSLAEFTAVVLIDLPSRAMQMQIADHCHTLGVAVMVGDTMGVFGTIFCDFGPSFVCHDSTGENNVTSMIANIVVFEACDSCLITVLEETPHQLESGDHVTLTEVSGLNLPLPAGTETYKVDVKDRYSFEISGLSGKITGRYEKGGYVNQVKQPVSVPFDSMSKSIVAPGMIAGDAFKLEAAPVLHIAFQALYAFKDQNGHFPIPGNRQHAAAVYQLALTMASSGPDSTSLEAIQKQEKTIMYLALGCRGQISPVCALVGGVLGQEVLKACSGKFMPIRQWFYYDAVEALPDLETLTESDLAPIGSRYDGQIMTFGKTMQARLAGLRMFVVGAGAIGCEMLKNFAMMGVGCSDSAPTTASNTATGCIYVTDMDQIEKSNLSRQFLFRNTDINSPKSTTAVRAVKEMNANFNGIAYESKVGPETEVLFNDDFFDSLTGVCTALDNIEARLYVDQRCLFYRKPMLDSGTLGTKGSTQVVIPGKTENYGATRDPPEKSFPICTLKHFPNQIEHTIAWARDWFEEVYKQTPEDCNTYLSSSQQEFLTSLANQQNMKLDTLVRMKAALVSSKPASFADCIIYARMQFQDLFSNKIKQLLHNFPLDKVVVTNGAAVPFWAGAKKPPSPLDFDSSDSMHIEFVLTVANLRAICYGIQDRLSSAEIDRVLSTIKIPEFSPSDGVTIPVTEEEAKAAGTGTAPITSSSSMVDIDDTCNQLLASLPAPTTLGGLTLRSVDFDKDVDDQMRVISACANLRARNYRISEVDLHRSRGIAGKIMPAIATTTALVTGHICLELFKVLLDRPVDKFMNTFSNLALPLFVCQEPDRPAGVKSVIKGKEYNWTVWDRIDIDEPSMTLAQLIAYLSEQYGVELSMLSAGVSILYSDFMDRKKSAERQGMTLKQVVEAVTKKTIPATQRFMILELICNDENTGDEVEMPCLRFRLPAME